MGGVRSRQALMLALLCASGLAPACGPIPVSRFGFAPMNRLPAGLSGAGSGKVFLSEHETHVPGIGGSRDITGGGEVFLGRGFSVMTEIGGDQIGAATRWRLPVAGRGWVSPHAGVWRSWGDIELANYDEGISSWVQHYNAWLVDAGVQIGYAPFKWLETSVGYSTLAGSRKGKRDCGAGYSEGEGAYDGGEECRREAQLVDEKLGQVRSDFISFAVRVGYGYFRATASISAIVTKPIDTSGYVRDLQPLHGTTIELVWDFE